MSYLLDANTLINAFRANAPAHARNYQWLVQTLGAGEAVHVSSIIEVALLRIMTNPRLGPDAAPAADVFKFLQDLHALPNYQHLELKTTQYRKLKQLVNDLNLSGNDMNDAYLAALALENNLTLVTADTGFNRFPGLRTLNPASE